MVGPTSFRSLIVSSSFSWPLTCNARVNSWAQQCKGIERIGKHWEEFLDISRRSRCPSGRIIILPNEYSSSPDPIIPRSRERYNLKDSTSRTKLFFVLNVRIIFQPGLFGGLIFQLKLQVFVEYLRNIISRNSITVHAAILPKFFLNMIDGSNDFHLLSKSSNLLNRNTFYRSGYRSACTGLAQSKLLQLSLQLFLTLWIFSYFSFIGCQES